MYLVRPEGKYVHIFTPENHKYSAYHPRKVELSGDEVQVISFNKYTNTVFRDTFCKTKATFCKRKDTVSSYTNAPFEGIKATVYKTIIPLITLRFVEGKSFVFVSIFFLILMLNVKGTISKRMGDLFNSNH